MTESRAFSSKAISRKAGFGPGYAVLQEVRAALGRIQGVG